MGRPKKISRAAALLSAGLFAAACAAGNGLFSADMLAGGRPPVGKSTLSGAVALERVDSEFARWNAHGDHEAFRGGLAKSLDAARLLARFPQNVRFRLSADLTRLEDRTPQGGPGMTAEVAYRVTGAGGRVVFDETIVTQVAVNLSKVRGTRPGAMNVEAAARAIRDNFRTLTETLAALRP